jgi:hypothetical protein
MARTIDEIYQDMITAKEADSNLDGLTSTSSVAVWRLIFYICAVAIKVIEDLFDVLKSDVEARREEIPVGTLQWYASESLVYQFGDDLVFADGKLDYPVIDETKFIVDLAASDLENSVVIIKVAKLDTGVAVPLSAAELAGFSQYWVEKRFAGESLSIISQNADLLKAGYRVTYDPQILAADGSSVTNPASFPVEDSINDFLQAFQSDNFAGAMRVMSLTDAIQATDGVVNVIATAIEAKFDGGTYTDVLATDNQTYVARAGYMKIDPAFPLSGSLNYVLT